MLKALRLPARAHRRARASEATPVGPPVNGSTWRLRVKCRMCATRQLDQCPLNVMRSTEPELPSLSARSWRTCTACIGTHSNYQRMHYWSRAGKLIGHPHTGQIISFGNVTASLLMYSSCNGEFSP